MNKSLPALLASFLFCLPAWGGEPAITDIREIHLGNGLNRIADMTADGKTGLVVKAWRPTGNAHSYNRFMIMVEEEKEQQPWQVVYVESPENHGASLRDSLRDEPHTGEDAVDTIMLARAQVGGQTETVLLEAYREQASGAAIPDPSPVVLKLYRLKIAEDGFPGYEFLQTYKTQSKQRYSNVNCALEKEFAVHFSRESKADDSACRG